MNPTTDNIPSSNVSAAPQVSGDTPLPAASETQAEAKRFQRPAGPDVVQGMIFRETRPDEIIRVNESIMKARKRAGIKSTLPPAKVFVRVLTVGGDWVRMISVEDPLADEEVLPRFVVVEYIERKDWVLSSYEPVKVVRFGERLSNAQKASRDHNMELLADIIAMDEEMWDREARAKLVRTISERKKVAGETIERVFRRYLQGGMVPNAVASRWTAGVEGADGQRRRILCGVEVRSGVSRPKFGRPRGDGAVGFLVTQPDVDKIIRGAVKYFHTPLGGNWHRAWLLTIAESYLDVDPRSSVPLEVQLKKHTAGSHPSLVQFKYWAKTDHEVVKRLKKRHGDRHYNLALRPLHSRTESSVAGPGSVFMIDGTTADVALVHCVTRKPIGRPKLYFVVDAFSHLIVGYCLSLENSGYDASVGAILSCMQDKQELCREFGIELDPGEWPAQCLPTLLVGDSEIATLKHHELVSNRILQFKVAPAYRPDLKGLVESLYASVNKTTLHHLPGRTSGIKFRTETNPDDLAVIDLVGLNRIIINFIRRHNLTVNKDYQMTEAMIADELVPTPLNLWNWGEVNCGGLRQVRDMEMLKRACLPTERAIIGRRGLAFQGVYYVPAGPDLPDFERWRVEAAGNTGRRVTITRNPMRVGQVWLHHEDRMIPMTLSDESKVYQAWTIIDLAAYFKARNAEHSRMGALSDKKMAALESLNLEEVRHATTLTEAVRGSLAKRRKEDTDKVAERANEKDIQNGSAFANSELPGTRACKPKPLAEKAENDAVARLRAIAGKN